MSIYHSSARPPTLLKNPLLFLEMLLIPFNKKAKEGLAATARFGAKGRGYFMEQATKPQTLGYSLADSPAGLLAWIYEKLVRWSDDCPWDDDEGAAPPLLHKSPGQG